MADVIRIGTRASQLALWQAEHIADLLRGAYPGVLVELVNFTTKGDTILDRSLPDIGGKGLFTEELERSLLAGEIDCAVHSLKDLPTEQPEGLVLGAIPQRAAVEDVLISKHHLELKDLKSGARIGTSSLRRSAQLLRYRNDFQIIDIRGNVPTRISKALDPDGPYDAIVVARAGVERLGLTEHISQILPLDVMLPAPGQGAIAVQCADTETARQLFSKINHQETALAVTAERAFLNQLEGGCSVPVAAYAQYEHRNLYLRGRVISITGSVTIEKSANVWLEGVESISAGYRAATLGCDVALDALSAGAEEILAEVRNDIAG